MSESAQISFEGDPRDLMKAASDVIGGLNRIEKKSKETGGAISKAMKKAAAAMKSALSGGFDMVFKWGKRGLVGLLAATTALTWQMSTLEGRVHDVWTMMGKAPITEIRQMQDEAFDLNRKYAIGLGNIGDALYTLTSNGIKGANALKMVTVGAKGAAGTSSSLAEIIRGLSFTMNAFQIPVDGSAKLMDQFVKTIEVANTELPFLVSGIGMVGDLAKQQKIPLEELLGAFAELSKTLPADVAWTALRGLLARFQDPKIREMGFDPFGKGLLGSITELNKKISKMNPRQAQDYMSALIPDRRAMQAFAALNNRLDGFRDKVRQIGGEWEGLTDSALRKQEMSFRHVIKRWTAQLTYFGQRIWKDTYYAISADLRRLGDRFDSWMDSAKGQAAMANIRGFLLDSYNYAKAIGVYINELFAPSDGGAGFFGKFFVRMKEYFVQIRKLQNGWTTPFFNDIIDVFKFGGRFIAEAIEQGMYMGSKLFHNTLESFKAFLDSMMFKLGSTKLGSLIVGNTSGLTPYVKAPFRDRVPNWPQFPNLGIKKAFSGLGPDMEFPKFGRTPVNYSIGDRRIEIPESTKALSRRDVSRDEYYRKQSMEAANRPAMQVINAYAPVTVRQAARAQVVKELNERSRGKGVALAY